MRRRMVVGMCLVALMASMQVAWSKDRVTDEMLSGTFGRAHTVMKGLGRHLHGVLDGLLTGDTGHIQQHASAITGDMEKVNRAYMPESGREAEQWQAVTDILTSARAMEVATKKGDYKMSYQYYAQLTSRCMACHQLRRAWGTFDEPQAPASQAPSAEPISPPR